MPDPDKTRELIMAFGALITEHMSELPPNRDRVYEALDALAFAAAITIKGADPDKALEYFAQSLNRILRDFPTPPHA
jgi:hypothetical protein